LAVPYLAKIKRSDDLLAASEAENRALKEE